MDVCGHAAPPSQLWPPTHTHTFLPARGPLRLGHLGDVLDPLAGLLSCLFRLSVHTLLARHLTNASVVDLTVAL